MVTDYDCWREGGDVDIAEILKVMHENADLARATVVELVKSLPAERPASPIDTVLDVALITAPEKRDVSKLDAILKRVMEA
jgi:5'-methylthioadenosine phosphorylase